MKIVNLIVKGNVLDVKNIGTQCVSRDIIVVKQVGI